MASEIIFSVSEPPENQTPGRVVGSWGVFEASPQTIAQMRRHPEPLGYLQSPPKSLKHADEQTIVGLAAVLRAVEDSGVPIEEYAGWGVVAAPRFVGRIAGAVGLAKFARAGGASTSPHLVSQQSLHSMAGMISIALGCRGPNFGTGGGPHAVADGLLAALALGKETDLPGIWLVMSEWDPEPVPDGQGGIAGTSLCRAVALSTCKATDGRRGLMFQLTEKARATARSSAPYTGRPDSSGSTDHSAASVGDLIRFLAEYSSRTSSQGQKKTGTGSSAVPSISLRVPIPSWRQPEPFQRRRAA